MRPPLRWLGALFVLLLAGLAVMPVGANEAQGHNRATRTPTRTPVGAGAPAAAPVSGRVRMPAIVQEARSTPIPSPTPVPRTGMAVGVNVHDNNFELVRDMGFPWVKLYADWDSSDPNAAVGLVDGAVARYPGVKILLRIDKSPARARTGNDDDPIDAAQLQSFLRALVPRLKGKVQAYELFNEPNLKWEWNSHIAGGSGMPSATGYARITRAAYQAIKESDPSALVITGGLSTAGDGGPESVGDLSFIDGMYGAGAAFDAIGVHPYGGPCSWDATACQDSVHFRRAETQYARAASRGGAGVKLWATELGWLVDPNGYGYGHCAPGLGGRINWVRSPQDVAHQLASAHRHAADHWPWMGGMFMFNFDYSAAGWVNGYDKVCDAPAWYSIVSKNNLAGRPYTEPAYDALRQFARDYGLTSR